MAYAGKESPANRSAGASVNDEGRDESQEGPEKLDGRSLAEGRLSGAAVETGSWKCAGNEKDGPEYQVSYLGLGPARNKRRADDEGTNSQTNQNCSCTAFSHAGRLTGCA
jgi:hypothetical protein